MTRFARDCVRTFTLLVRELESTLGPDTSDLQLRVGMHSGPVTGGYVSRVSMWTWFDCVV